MKSIRQYLTLLLISSFALVCFIAALQGYRAGMEKSARLFDAELSVISKSMSSMPIQLADEIPATNNDLAIQHWSNKSLLLRTSNAPETPMAEFKTGYSEQNFNAQRWRVHASYNNLYQKWAFVAQPLKTRFELTEEMMISAMTPLFISIPLLTIAVFLLVTYGLSPLRDLAHQLSNKAENDFSSIRLAYTPKELESPVNTLNKLLDRLNNAFEREKQFASHAAHQLRTPLSVLKINLHNLQHSQIEDQSSILQLQNDTDRMIHVVNQILVLSRTNPELMPASMESCDPIEIAQGVISDIYTQIDQKNQSIELIGEHNKFQSNEFALNMLMQNLIANANKYTPEGGNIRVSLSIVDDYLTLQVDDSGPGIPEQERPFATDRFYRGRHTDKSNIDGSGLGLSIVDQIVEMHSGSINFGVSDLGGLSVSLRLYPL